MDILPIVDRRLPRGCEAFLVPPGQGDVWGGRAWLEATLHHAIPVGAEPVFGIAPGQVFLPLLRCRRRLGSLTTPYSLRWHPIAPGGPGPEAFRIAGRALGHHLRLTPPAIFEALDPEDPEIAALLVGLRDQGLRLLRYDHFGNWQEDVTAGWADYLAARPPALQNTIRRKLARAAGRLEFEMFTAPGPALESAIAAFEAVRAQSWKPEEPFPQFDAALMRNLAETGELRLAVLRDAADRAPVAAQYWIVSGGRAVVPKLFHTEAMRAASPGTVLTAMAIRHLIEKDGVRVLDFGRGDDAYKRLWVASRQQRIGVMAVDPRHPAGLSALLRHAAGRLRKRLRRDAAPEMPG